MLAAISIWVLFLVAHCAYRFRFEYKDIFGQPPSYRSARMILLSGNYVVLAIIFVLAAIKAQMEVFAGVVLIAWALHIIQDWWAYRRELSVKARLQIEANQMDREMALYIARGFLAEHKYGWNYSALKPKKAWVAFLLTLFFGPLGFFYHQWRVAVGFLVLIIPYSALSTVPLSEAVPRGSLRYVMIIGMAGLALLDVLRKNDKIPISPR